MAYDRELAGQIRRKIVESGWKNVEEKEKNEGLSFTLKDEPFVRLEDQHVVTRCYPEDTDMHLQTPGVYRYEVNDRIDIKSWLVLHPEETKLKNNLDKWLQVSYNYVSTVV